MTHLLGAAFCLWIADYFSAVWFGYPFVYCLGAAFMAPLFAPWFHLALMGCALYLLFVLVTGLGFGLALRVAVLMILLGGLPELARTLLSFGHACGP